MHWGQQFIVGEEEEYKLLKEQLADLDMKRKEFTDSLSGETSVVYRELSEVYPRDTKVCVCVCVCVCVHSGPV